MIDIVFDNPVYLWYLLSIPVLIISHFIFLKNAKFKAMTFSNFETIKRITGKGPGKIITKNWMHLFVRLIILISVILAISAPVVWYDGETSDRDFVLAIDTSASMLAQDFNPNRLESAKTHAINFVDSLNKNTNIGLVDFAGTSFIDNVLTSDRTKLKTNIESLEVVPLGGTDIPGAIIASSNLLMTSEKTRILVLISDGSNTVDVFNQKALLTAINYAKDNHVVIHSIGIGSESAPVGYLPEYYNVTAVYDAEQLKFIANATQGNFYEGRNETQFSQIFTNLAGEIKEGFIQKNLQPLLLLIGLLGLFLEWGMFNTKFRRLP